MKTCVKWGNIRKWGKLICGMVKGFWRVWEAGNVKGVPRSHPYLIIPSTQIASSHQSHLRLTTTTARGWQGSAEMHPPASEQLESLTPSLPAWMEQERCNQSRGSFVSTPLLVYPALKPMKATEWELFMLFIHLHLVSSKKKVLCLSIYKAMLFIVPTSFPSKNN